MDLRQFAVFACAAAFALACGDKFVAVDPGAGGSTSMTSAGKSTAGGEPEGGSDGGGTESGGRGGTEPRGGAGKGGASGFETGGVINVGGVGGLGGGGTAPAPPIPTNGLELWLRADEGVAIEGDGVATWKDASGNHRDATQISNNFRPLVVPNAIVDRPAIVFDGKDDFLQLPTLSVSFAAGFSIFTVLEQAAANTCDPYFEASNDREIDDIHFGDWQSSLLFEVEENWVNDTNYPLLLNQPVLAAAVQDAQGTARVRSNNNSVGERDVNFAPERDRTQVFIGKSLYADCSPYHGAIGEMIVYSRGVTDAEVVKIEKYLQAKWACCTK